jgi:hypothetical protein
LHSLLPVSLVIVFIPPQAADWQSSSDSIFLPESHPALGFDRGFRIFWHQALTSLLYLRALYAAQKQATPEIIDKLVTTITKLEKLKTERLSSSCTYPSVHRSNNPPLTTRHRVELSIVPAGPSPTAPKIVEITTAALPASENSQVPATS